MRILALSTLLSTACASTPAPVSLSGEWPSKPGQYHEVTESWTRTGQINGGLRDKFDKWMEVVATFHSPQWRAAYVEFRGKREMLPRNGKSKLLEEQRVNAGKFYEVTLLFETYNHRENDLQRGRRSVWRVALVDAEGNEVEATEVKSVRTPPDYLRPYYPKLRTFHEVYVARFPKEGLDIFGPGKNKFSLKVASARGGVELFWRTK